MPNSRKKPSERSSAENLTDLLSEVMVHLTDANKANSQAINEIKPLVQDTKEISLDVLKKFQNGFRQEIKSYISLEIKTHTEIVQQSLVDISKKLSSIESKIDANGAEIKSFRNTIRKPAFWIKLLTGFLVAISTTFAALNSVCNHPLQKSPPTASNTSQ